MRCSLRYPFRKNHSPTYESGVYRKPIATLKSNHVMMIRIKTGVGYTPAKAIVIKSTVSRSCDHRLERLERSQKYRLPILALKKKNETTSWYSATMNATSEAIAMRNEIPKTVL